MKDGRAAAIIGALVLALCAAVEQVGEKIGFENATLATQSTIRCMGMRSFDDACLLNAPCSENTLLSVTRKEN